MEPHAAPSLKKPMIGISTDGRHSVGLVWALTMSGIAAVQFFCFYWWPAEIYYFTGDGLYYFSRLIDSWTELARRFLSTDELYQYRPLTYVFFTFVLFPLFGTNAAPYHLTAYLFSTANVLLACGCIYYWIGRRKTLAAYAAIFLFLNPVHFFPSFGPTYVDQWLSSSFYFGALLVILRDDPRFVRFAPVMFAFALASKEHSVLLPAHAVLILSASDVSFREALRKTRSLWVVLAVFAAFQLTIRDGVIFAPPGSNPNFQFSLAADRLIGLAKGAKPAIFYPENYGLDDALIIGRPIRLSMLIVVGAAILMALRRHPRLAVSGLLWFALSLAPVVFLKQAPAPRHYHLGLAGLAVVFACAIPSRRTMMAVTPVLALITISNVHLYLRESGIAHGARRTRSYLTQIQAVIEEKGSDSFYVAAGGDPHFYWHVDGGLGVPPILGRSTTFRFAAMHDPLDTDRWLNNAVDVILPQDGAIQDVVRAGQFPPRAAPELCRMIAGITGVESRCSVLFRGHAVLDATRKIVETPNGLPVFEVPEGIVTLSRTTIHIAARAGFDLKRTVYAVPESVDGVRVEFYAQYKDGFQRLISEEVQPGERRELQFYLPPGRAEHVVIRIHPGTARNEQSDWLIWVTD